MAKAIAKALKNAVSKNADDAIKGSRNVINLSSDSYKITDAVMPKSGNFSTSAQRPIIAPPTPRIEDIKVKSGNFTTDSRDYKIARYRARNEARNSKINNDVIKAQGPNPNLLRLEDRTTKMENAMNMIDAGMPEGMKVLEQLDQSHNLKTRTPVR